MDKVVLKYTTPANDKKEKVTGTIDKIRPVTTLLNVESEIKPLQSFHEKEVSLKIQRMLDAEKVRRDRHEYIFETEPMLEISDEQTNIGEEKFTTSYQSEKKAIAEKLKKNKEEK